MADRAFLRGIGRVYKDQRHANYDCLIGYELSKLPNAPGLVITSLSLRNHCPGPDSLKTFKRYQVAAASSPAPSAYAELSP